MRQQVDGVPALLSGLRDDVVERVTDGVQGDALNPADVDRAMKGIEAVIVTLGITENSIAVRLRGGAANTALGVRSAGTKNVIEGMRSHGARKLVVQTTYGVAADAGTPRTDERHFQERGRAGGR